MATPLSKFTLDRSIFNNALYTSITDFWFHGVPPDAKVVTQEKMMLWYGAGPPEAKTAFDKDCSLLTRTALTAIGPSKLELPTFKSHEDDEKHAGELAAPFLEEVARADDPSAVLLAFALLLDQMPRNLFREPNELPMVYTHYDRLALATMRSSMKKFENPFQPYNGRWVAKMWFFMPFMHSEDLSAHKLWRLEADKERQVADEAGNKEVCQLIDRSIFFEEKHLEPLEKFGRYPHRNECLQRKDTPEEKEYLKTADTFGVKQKSETEKSEL